MRLAIKVLIVLIGSFSMCFGQCKKIAAEATVTDTRDGLKNGKIELKIDDKKDFSISLFGQRSQNKLEIDKTEISDLSKGKYLIVIVGKKEDENYCPKSIEVTIN